jgi:hypothetical protein
VFPDPASYEPWSQATDVRSGTGGEVIEAYIEANAGASALPARQFPGLVVQSGVYGTSGVWTGRLQALSEMVRRVATESGLVVEPTLSPTLTPTVYVREASNRTAEVVIADIADLAEAEERDSPSRSTWVLAAGGGEGASRSFRSADGGGEGLARIEKVVEASNATTLNELFQIAEANRREDGWALHVVGRLNDDAAERYDYQVHYQLGDTVTVQVSGFRRAVPIEAVEITVSPDASGATNVTEVPTLGAYSPNRLRAIDRRILGLTERFDDNIA